MEEKANSRKKNYLRRFLVLGNFLQPRVVAFSNALRLFQAALVKGAIQPINFWQKLGWKPCKTRSQCQRLFTKPSMSDPKSHLATNTIRTGRVITITTEYWFVHLQTITDLLRYSIYYVYAKLCKKKAKVWNFWNMA